MLKAAFSSSFVEGWVAFLTISQGYSLLKTRLIFGVSQTQTYKIVDTSPGCFKFFVQWIYGQRLDVKQLKPDFEKEALGALDPDWVDKEDMMLAELWVFADKFAIPRLQNKCIESMLHILAGCSNMLPLPTMKYIYGNTSPESQLRKFATHQCYHMDAERWVNNSEYFPHELLFDHVILAAKVQSGEKKAPPQISKLKASDYFVPVEEVLNRRYDSPAFPYH